MRIKDLPEATELAEDDYLVLASEGGGACKILAKKFEPVLLRINAVYTQTETVCEDTPLDDLKTDLVVTAYYQGGGSRVVDNYTLSGTLEVGTSTITATYKGFSDTFEVTVKSSINYIYKWDLTKSLTDEIQGITAIISGLASFTEGEGVKFTGSTGKLELLSTTQNFDGKTIELDISMMGKKFSNSHGKLIMADSNNGFIYRTQTSKWECYNGAWGSYTLTSDDANVFNGKTAKFVINNLVNDIEVYADDVLIYKGNGWGLARLYIGYSSTFYDMTITGVRIYTNQ
jgi:hypothetical protein